MRKSLLVFVFLIVGFFLFYQEAKADSFMCQCAYSSGTIESATIDQARSRCLADCDSLGGFIGIFPAEAPSGTCDFCCCTDGSTNSGEGVSCYETCLSGGGIQSSQTYNCSSPPASPPTCQAAELDCVAACAGDPDCLDGCPGSGLGSGLGGEQDCVAACAGDPDCLDGCPGSGLGSGLGGGLTPGVRLEGARIPNWLGTDSISDLIASIANFLITYIAIPLAILMIVLAGFRFVLAQGNEEKINAAKKNFVWTVVGIAIVLASSMIIAYIRELLGDSQGNTLVNFINRVKGTLSLVIGVLFALVTVYFIWGIIQYVTSGGDEEKLKQGKQHMVWGIIGMAIMGAAAGIVAMIGSYVTGQ